MEPSKKLLPPNPLNSSPNAPKSIFIKTINLKTLNALTAGTTMLLINNQMT